METSGVTTLSCTDTQKEAFNVFSQSVCMTASHVHSLSAHSVFFGGVFMSLQHLDSVSTAKPLNVPHTQVSEFLTKKHGSYMRGKRQ